MDCSVALLSFNTITRLLTLQEQIIENNYNGNSSNLPSPCNNIILLYCNYNPSNDYGSDNTLVYTILEIQSISSIFDMSGTTTTKNNDKTKEDDGKEESLLFKVDEITIHPILSEILTLCSNNIKINNVSSNENNADNDMEIDSNNNDDDTTNHHYLPIPVSLSSDNDNHANDSISYHIHPIKELKKDYLNDDDPNTKLQIHIDYWFIDENNTNNHNEDNIIELLSNSLEGRIVSKGCILLVTIPTACFYNDDDDDDDTNNDDLYVVIKINDIFFIDKNEDDNNCIIDRIECYRLGLSNSFNLIIPSSSSSESQIGYNETEIKSSDVNNNLSIDEKEKEDNKFKISTKGYCYESEFNELYKLSIISLNNNLTTTTAITSGILITGISGIGKSYLVEKVVTKINNIGKNKNLLVNTTSCNDLLLAASSSSFNGTTTSVEDYLIGNIILPFDILKSTTRNNNTRIVLVIDDLNILYPLNNKDNNDNIDSTIAKNAINESIKILQKQCSNYILIGIYKTSDANIPKELYTINKFEHVIQLNVPTQYQRELLLYTILSNYNFDCNIIEYYSKVIASHTSGYIASDLKRICMNAYITTSFFQSNKNINNNVHNNSDLITYYQTKIKETTTSNNNSHNSITLNDLLQSIQKYKPNQLSTIDVISPNKQQTILSSNNNLINNDELLFYNNCNNMNFGGYTTLKKRIYRSVIQPWKRYLSYQYKQSSTSSTKIMQHQQPPKGIIIHGPSGNGKTNLSYILSTTLNFQLLQIKQTSILNKWLGSSEENIRNIFSNAYNCSPCIILFDDIDSFTSSRNDYNDDDGGDNVYSRILSTLLNEMDGISNTNNNQNIFIIGTTNRLNAVDSALLRPGRIEEHICISKPNVDDMLDIMLMYTKQMNLHDNVHLKDIVNCIHNGSCEYNKKSISCADIEGICREACFSAMRRLDLRNEEDDEDDELLLVENIDFQEAIHTVLSL